MGCCGNIVKGFGALGAGIKYEFTDGRVRICHKCKDNEWKARKLFCKQCKCFIPAKARVKDENCPLGKW